MAAAPEAHQAMTAAVERDTHVQLVAQCLSADIRDRHAELVWSAGPNMFVEQQCRGLSAGRVIDLAAGEGRNAIWFAELGWDATAVDYSSVAIDKAHQIAERRGVAITTAVADLADYEPTPSGYDLVVIAYLQLVDTELAPILHRAAAAVAPTATVMVRLL